MPKMINNISDCIHRNNFINELVKTEYLKGRKILILGDRREYLNRTEKWIKENIKPNIVGQKTKFSIAPAQEMAAEQALNVFKSRRANSSTNVPGVPSTVRTAADTIYQTLRNWTRKGVDRVVFTEALINRAVESGIMSAAEFKQLMQARGVETRKFEKEVEGIAAMYLPLLGKLVQRLEYVHKQVRVRR